jgi:hypothetical protein
MRRWFPNSFSLRPSNLYIKIQNCVFVMGIHTVKYFFLLNFTFCNITIFNIEINSASVTSEEAPGEQWLPFSEILYYAVWITYCYHPEVNGFKYTEYIGRNVNQTLYVWI